MFIIFERGSPELELAWNKLSELSINRGDKACLDSLTGERWQYLSSNKTQHTFRHRRHPQTKERMIINIPVE